MKWKTRFIICRLLAGLTALIYSGCTEKKPSIQLITSQTLDFPSASGIEFYNGNLYLFGDNAPYFLVLSPSYQLVKKIAYWPDTTAVIPKDEKPDIESAMILEIDSKPVLLGIGSLSGEHRWPVYEWAIGSDSAKKTRLFPNSVQFQDIKEINIEGSTAVGHTMVFCNRANLTTRTNHLLFRENKNAIAVRKVRLPQTGSVAGMSGLYYVKEKDLLLFTASEEATYNAKDDGEIGESYIGWIHNFSSATKDTIIQASGMLKLSSFAPVFKGQKVEGVCTESKKGDLFRLHLVADNDNGRSGIFTVDLQL